MLTELADGPRRYQDLFDSLQGISYKVLTDTLRRAARDGLISRTLDTRRLRSTAVYDLTELGRSFDTALTNLAEWTADHWADVETMRGQWDLRLTEI